MILCLLTIFTNSFGCCITSGCINIKNFENLVDISTLNYLLSEARDCCKKTLHTFKIAHMIIDNYQADEKKHKTDIKYRKHIP